MKTISLVNSLVNNWFHEIIFKWYKNLVNSTVCEINYLGYLVTSFHLFCQNVAFTKFLRILFSYQWQFYTHFVWLLNFFAELYVPKKNYSSLEDYFLRNPFPWRNLQKPNTINLSWNSRLRWQLAMIEIPSIVNCRPMIKE